MTMQISTRRNTIKSNADSDYFTLCHALLNMKADDLIQFMRYERLDELYYMIGFNKNVHNTINYMLNNEDTFKDNLKVFFSMDENGDETFAFLSIEKREYLSDVDSELDSELDYDYLENNMYCTYFPGEAHAIKDDVKKTIQHLINMANDYTTREMLYKIVRNFALTPLYENYGRLLAVIELCDDHEVSFLDLLHEIKLRSYNTSLLLENMTKVDDYISIIKDDIVIHEILDMLHNFYTEQRS